MSVSTWDNSIMWGVRAPKGKRARRASFYARRRQARAERRRFRELLSLLYSAALIAPDWLMQEWLNEPMCMSAARPERYSRTWSCGSPDSADAFAYAAQAYKDAVVRGVGAFSIGVDIGAELRGDGAEEVPLGLKLYRNELGSIWA
jgi:hypothetical protein